MVVTTPYHAAQVSRLAGDTPVVTATLSLDPLYSLMGDWVMYKDILTRKIPF